MTRVAIIGAGPCGLSQLQAFAKSGASEADQPEIVCFDKLDDWGGIWHYTWRTGLDQYGEPVHGSMYRYLWSNGPKECLEFADYTFDDHFGKPIPSFPPREVLHDYITGRAKKSGVRDLIRFNTAVRHVAFDEADGVFSVTVEDLPNKHQYTEQFDHVVVATGHFSVPNVPQFPGIETFQGRVMHGHDFRSADEFKGKDLVVVGGSYSAEDIALQSKKYGANSVTISYRSQAMGFHWPDGMKEVPLITKVEGRKVSFKDGSSVQADAIILCTGYLHHFPFLVDGLKLKTHNRMNPPGLYKGIFWLDNPKLIYLGMQDQFYTFSMFDAQAWYARDVILGRIELPPKADMATDVDLWVTREEKLADPFEMIDFQTDYTKELVAATDYPDFDLDMVADLFKEWEHDKEQSITGYRDKAFKSPCTGTMAPMHHTPWIDALDDSMAAFLATKSS
jgi:trimethylamine monooxygenase